MTTTAVQEQKAETRWIASPTFEELVKVYHDNGFSIWSGVPGRGDRAYPYAPLHRIRFEGDSEEGKRGVELARNRRFPLARMIRVWEFFTGDNPEPYWELSFYDHLR